ncbi:9589_t:CDS:2 [Ambispora leptoticha]|uniref:9589_t:CDS:1 n=1 Tax=Ambispora leptoticha TaxID=144679 RepID=A0A9N9A9C2_9GLOM|nr:9589_t:CDS:2 [Ambispora leptoticha]
MSIKKYFMEMQNKSSEIKEKATSLDKKHPKLTQSLGAFRAQQIIFLSDNVLATHKRAKKKILLVSMRHHPVSPSQLKYAY